MYLAAQQHIAGRSTPEGRRHAGAANATAAFAAKLRAIRAKRAGAA